MVRGGWLAVAFFLLLAAPARADWLQPGYDSAQTGNTPEAGPDWDDVVFQLKFPVLPQDATSLPVVVSNGSAFVAFNADGSNHLVRVFLANATAVEIAQPSGGYPEALASDGQRIFVLGDIGVLSAFSTTGEALWQSRVQPRQEADPSSVQRFNGIANCYAGTLLVADGSVYAACNAHAAVLLVVAFDAREGSETWTYLRDGTMPVPNRQQGIPVVSSATAAAGAVVPPTAYAVYPTGLTKLGEVVIAAALFFETPAADGGSRGAIAYGEYDGIGADGTTAWVERIGVGGDLSERQTGNTGSANAPPPATGDSGRAYLELAAVEEWLPDNDGPYPDRYVPIRAQGSQLEGDPASGFSLAEEGLYATSQRSLFLLDASFTIVRSTEASGGCEWGPGSLAHAANGFLYATVGANGAGLAGTHASIEALRTRDLSSAWIHSFATDTRFAVSDGLLVAWSSDGTLTVLGKNPASPRPLARVSTDVPAPGDLVTVDLAASGPGLFGNVTQYRADWGDGTQTDWQPSPVLEHRFSTLTNVESRFFVKNAANQTASVTQLFVVGGQPELNFLQRQFSADNQNTTFFVLGLLATLLAALWGIVNVRRSHRRLSRELRTLEERLTSREGQAALDQALRQARSRAQELLARRKLDHGQYLVLTERIDDLQRGHRMSVVDERLSFLPHGMVKRLEAMLADAQVTGWERHHFLEALDGERNLTALQRRQVRELVDGWFRSDVPDRPV